MPQDVISLGEVQCGYLRDFAVQLELAFPRDGNQGKKKVIVPSVGSSKQDRIKATVDRGAERE